MFKTVPATKDRLLEIAVDVREADRKEVFRTTGLSVTESLYDSVEASKEAFIVLYNDKSLCIFGVIVPNHLSNIAHPWFITTNKIENHKKEFLKKSKEFVEVLLDDYDTLFNYVDAEYEDAVKWLKWIGFTILPSVPYGAKGDLFHPFIMRKK